MLVGRWSSDVFLKHIRKQVLEKAKVISSRMLKNDRHSSCLTLAFFCHWWSTYKEQRIFRIELKFNANDLKSTSGYETNFLFVLLDPRLFLMVLDFVSNWEFIGLNNKSLLSSINCASLSFIILPIRVTIPHVFFDVISFVRMIKIICEIWRGVFFTISWLVIRL